MRLTDFSECGLGHIVLNGGFMPFNAAWNGSSLLQLYSDSGVDAPETAGEFLLNQMRIELSFHDRYSTLPVSGSIISSPNCKISNTVSAESVFNNSGTGRFI